MKTRAAVADLIEFHEMQLRLEPTNPGFRPHIKFGTDRAIYQSASGRRMNMTRYLRVCGRARRRRRPPPRRGSHGRGPRRARRAAPHQGGRRTRGIGGIRGHAGGGVSSVGRRRRLAGDGEREVAGTE